MKKGVREKEEAERLLALFEKARNIIKTSNGAIKLRSSRLAKSIAFKDSEISRLKERHTKFKTAVITYHKNFMEKNKGEEHAFLKALEKYDVSGSTFEQLFQEQLLNSKNNVDILNDKENFNQKISYLVVSPNKDLMSLKNITSNQYPKINSKQGNISSLNQSGLTTASISTMESCTPSPKNMIKDDMNVRFKLHHVLKSEIIFKKRCNNCCHQDSKTPMNKCSQCGVYIHETCPKSTICIALKKINLKISSGRTLPLNELCKDSKLPMVPNILLAIMNRIHSVGLTTENIYTLEGKDKEVKDLCNKLLDGELKYLNKCNTRIISNAFIMLLKSLREPLLSSLLLSKLKCFIDLNGSMNWDGIAKSLIQLPREVKDTLIYTLIHLKVISQNAACKFNSERLANTFTPILVDSDYTDSKTIQVVTMLIDLDIIFYDNYFISEVNFFGSHFKELQRISVTNT